MYRLHVVQKLEVCKAQLSVSLAHQEILMKGIKKKLPPSPKDKSMTSA